jgi:hypothetical protein
VSKFAAAEFLPEARRRMVDFALAERLGKMQICRAFTDLDRITN